MLCPYCLSAVDVNASVCKVCTKDIYLFKDLLGKIELLEKKVEDFSTSEELQIKVSELENQLKLEYLKQEDLRKNNTTAFWDFIRFLLFPLFLLLISHALITIVYDINMLYLRLISIVLPLPFAYILFSSQNKYLFKWFVLTAFLSLGTVFGMSTITSLVDQTPILPQNNLEIKEFIEYSASILFSFFTGMLLGSFTYSKKHQILRSNNSNNIFLRLLVNIFTKGKISPKSMQELISKINEFGGTIVVLGSTLVSIYSGLKALY
jgi:hypothetical protein